MYLAVDPGVTSGWALFGADGQSQVNSSESATQGQVRGLTAFKAFLAACRPTPEVIIVEGYNVRPQAWRKPGTLDISESTTLAVIREIKFFAKQNEIKLVTQQPNVKPMGYKWNKEITSPGEHSTSHSKDAFAHGIYYLVMHKIRKLERAGTSE